MENSEKQETLGQEKTENSDKQETLGPEKTENSEKQEKLGQEKTENSEIFSDEEEEYLDAKESDVDYKDEEDLDDETLQAQFKDKSEDEIQIITEKVANLKMEGNEHFKKSDYYDAIKIYTQALNTCPPDQKTDRSILYANRAAARINLDKKEEAVLDCNKALDLNPTYMKALIRRAQVQRKLNNLEDCLADYQKILELDPSNMEARQACAVLPSEIAERNEKLKTEMMGKLKDLGNLVLRPFGLSTDNFQVVQDPNSGGYSVNFQNNASKNT